MAATLTQDRFAGPEWIFEGTLDGIRLLAIKPRTDVRLYSRTRLPQNCQTIATATAGLPLRELILDGDLLWRSAPAGREVHPEYHVFDVMWIDNRDMTRLPLQERRALLHDLPLRPPLERVGALDDSHPW